jgi:hypothetical protein
MEIVVSLKNGKLSFAPDPAYVSVGELVNWRFRSPIMLPLRRQLPLEIRWTIYFPVDLPFRFVGGEILITTKEDPQRGSHDGATPPVSADQPGDYKYGVRAQDAATSAVIDDEDPRLIVRP